ncbi:lipid asymmetry maintenance protein MlaB [Vibrio hepatarius]|uniref:STAS domain-containing protein n=1 Tax=Vibrio hepatarius TaxID=171383 RepID=UPI003735C048
MSMHVYVLPAELTIYEVEQTHSEMVAALHEHEDVSLDAQYVTEMDSAGFQLVIWFICHQSRVEHQTKLLNLAPAVCVYLELFGITDLIE